MKRENLKNLGLGKEVIDQIMTWNGFDIEAEKKKCKEVEKHMDELNAKITAKEEAEDIKVAQAIGVDMFREAVNATRNRDKRIFLAVL